MRSRHASSRATEEPGIGHLSLNKQGYCGLPRAATPGGMTTSGIRLIEEISPKRRKTPSLGCAKLLETDEDKNPSYGGYGSGSTICVNTVPGEDSAWPRSSNWSGYEKTSMLNNSTDQNGNLDS
uniref:Uncharacterized protein n=1 Tax=Leersia perrieri TaxID=77586 RepID=A0A0D9Y094_9ORYZ